MVESYKSIELINHKSNLQFIERFVEGICDDLNIYNNYYGIINSSLTEIFEACCTLENEKTVLSYQNSKGIISFSFENKHFNSIINPKINLDSDDFFFSEDLSWLVIVKNLTDKLQVTENKLEIGFNISSINAEMAMNRAGVLSGYFESKRIKKAHLN